MGETIVVLLGGKSAEREVSLKTGDAIFRALLGKGYNARKVDLKDDKLLLEQLTSEKPDLVFLALHGRYGEDGTIQGLLETLGIPYTGSGVLASALCINKVITKKLLKADRLPTADFYSVNLAEYNSKGESLVKREILSALKLPFVVKPANEGSTIGLSVINKPEQLSEGLRLAFAHDKQILVEEFVRGVEVTAGIVGNLDPIILPLVEIVPKKGFYDYESKYTKGMTEYIVPARLPKEYYFAAQEVAKKAYLTLGCKGTARVDMIVGGNGIPYILEVNTIPGMTETSLLPKAASAAGIEFDDLISKLVQLALADQDLG